MDVVTTADPACGAPAVRCWSTTDVDTRDALAYWCDSICHAMLELDIESAHGESFRARLEQCALGPATLNFLWATSQQVIRSRDAISRARQAVFHLVHLRAGRFRMEHCGRTAELHAGDCVLIDSREPHVVMCPQPTSCLIVQLPQEWLRVWVPAPENLLGRVLHSRGGWAAALCAAVDNLRPENLDGLPVPAGVVAEQIATLLALAGGPVHPAPSRSEQLYVRLSRALRDRYHEIGLTPGAIAADLGISVRYLHMLFARRHMTFGEQLLEVRLERAREVLRDARFADLPIGEVAASCGFAEASHFARCFREQYGSAPSVFRATVHPQPIGLAP
jgi:AraC family transcriptional regulator, positive regulator of tynA and feaB